MTCPFCGYENNDEEPGADTYVTPFHIATAGNCIDMYSKIECESCGRAYCLHSSYLLDDYELDDWTRTDEDNLRTFRTFKRN